MTSESAGSEPLELELAAEPRSIPVARDAVSRFARASGVDPVAVTTAVSEAVTNAVLHAYRGRTPGTVAIHARQNGEGIVVTVADQGAGIAPNPDSPGLGMGLALAGSLADRLEIESAPGAGTRVGMRFGLLSRAA